MVRIDKPKRFDIASGTFEDVNPTGTRLNGDQHRFQVVGPGTADIQPVIAGLSTHKAETVTNDSVVLDLTSVDNFRVTASGGNITVIYTQYRVS